MRSKAAFLGVVGVLMSITIVGAETTFSKDCAAQDLRLVTAIEEHGNAGTLTSEKLSTAYSSLLNARATCQAGQIAKAIQLYVDISLPSQEASEAKK